MKVFAKWTDRKYYPGEVGEPISAGQWQILFHDGKQKVLPGHSILANNTLECDQTVLALVSDNTYKLGTIIHVKSFEDKEDEYLVKFSDGKSIEVSWSKISLSEQQAQYYRDGQQSTSSGRTSYKRSIDLDNVVHGKRLRSSKSGSPYPLSSSKEPKASSSSSMESSREPDSSLIVDGLEKERPSADPLSSKGPRRQKGRKGKAAEKALTVEDEKMLEVLGPIPPAGSTIFAGLTFFITSASDAAPKHEHPPKSPKAKGKCSDSEADTANESDCFTDCEAFDFTTIKQPMAKARLKEQLEAGGGRVLSYVDELSADELNNEDALKKMFLVTDRPCKTPLYIRCLAVRIRSILYDGVILCCKENRPLEPLRYLLPAGYSATKKRFIAWSELKNRKPFTDIMMRVLSQDHSFVTYWERVLESAGATIDKKSNKDLMYVTVIVAKYSLPGPLKAKAEEANSSVVSYHWVIQSLINNEVLSGIAHETFYPEHSESE